MVNLTNEEKNEIKFEKVRYSSYLNYNFNSFDESNENTISFKSENLFESLFNIFKNSSADKLSSLALM